MADCANHLKVLGTSDSGVWLDNKLTREIYRQLLQQYFREKDGCDAKTLQEFKETVPLMDCAISRTTGVIANNIIHKNILENVAWTGIFFLRGMLGPKRCTKQMKRNASAGHVPMWYMQFINQTLVEWDFMVPSAKFVTITPPKTVNNKHNG
ncbi:hypothetical protein ACHAPE_002753 [Trichoderma viride]